MSREDTDARFESLYRRYYRSVVAFFCRNGFAPEAARDLAQTAFYGVYRSMEKYRGDAEWTFLQTTARNVLYNEIRGRHAEKRAAATVSLDETPRRADSLSQNLWTGESPSSPEAKLVAREKTVRRRQRLQAAITELSPAHRRCFLLRLGGHTYKEIQTALGITLDAVKSCLYEAKKHLRERLGNELPPGEEF